MFIEQRLSSCLTCTRHVAFVSRCDIVDFVNLYWIQKVSLICQVLHQNRERSWQNVRIHSISLLKSFNLSIEAQYISFILCLNVCSSHLSFWFRRRSLYRWCFSWSFKTKYEIKLIWIVSSFKFKSSLTSIKQIDRMKISRKSFYCLKRLKMISNRLID